MISLFSYEVLFPHRLLLLRLMKSLPDDVFHGAHQLSHTSIFSPASFSRTRVSIAKYKGDKLESIDEIRRLYEGQIPALKPETPGGRVDFFVQVIWALRVGASVIGMVALGSAWYGFKVIRSR